MNIFRNLPKLGVKRHSKPSLIGPSTTITSQRVIYILFSLLYL